MALNHRDRCRKKKITNKIIRYIAFGQVQRWRFKMKEHLRLFNSNPLFFSKYTFWLYPMTVKDCFLQSLVVPDLIFIVD